jgi:hypothetical protein
MANDNMVRANTLANHETDPTKESFFNGYVSHGKNTRDPYVSGFAFIKWIKVPTWIGAAKNDQGREFKQLTERNFKAFQGLNDMQMDTGAITAGFTNNELSHAKGTVQKAEGFTLRYQEQSGSPITKVYNEWVSGIRDPKTGIATYPKKSGLAYHSDNHTGILLYVVTRPDADNFGGAEGNIEFAALFTHVMPTKIILNHFNYESGSHEFADSQEQEFKGYLNIGEAVEKFAAAQMSANNIYKFYNENDFLNLNEFAPSIPSA